MTHVARYSDTHLSASKILIYPTSGSTIDVIDWEFASTSPPEVAENYPLLLHKSKFVNDFEAIFDNTLSELGEWRAFYTKQLDDYETMKDSLRNIDYTISFEELLCDNDKTTIEHLVEVCKFLESPAAIDQVQLPFPWTSPTIVPIDHISSTAVEGRAAPTVEKTKTSVQTERIPHNDRTIYP